MTSSDQGLGSVELERRLLESVLEGGPASQAPALTHLLQAGGKRLRPRLVDLFGGLCQGQPEKLIELALAVELLHTATLAHDDIIDSASSRRGRATLHLLTDSSTALLVGDLLVARCGVHAAATGDPQVTAEVFGALALMVRGELDQRRHRFDLGQTAQDYLVTVRRKTSSLLEAACAGAAMVSLAPDGLVAAARAYGHNLGVAFQVADDLLDFAGCESELGKPVGGDLRDGTITLPVILAMEEDAGLGAAIDIARESGDFTAVLERVRGSGAMQRSRDLANDHAEAAAGCLSGFPERPQREALAALAREVVDRRF